MLGLLDFVKKQQCRIFEIKASVNDDNAEFQKSARLSTLVMFLEIKRCEELTRVKLLAFQRLPGAFFVSGYGILADMC